MVALPGWTVSPDDEVGTVYTFGGPRMAPYVCEECEAYLLIDVDDRQVDECPVCGGPYLKPLSEGY